MIELDRATVQIGSATLLNKASTAIHHGQVTVVIGPNGAGKTTLLRSASGVQDLTSGEARMDDRPLGAMTMKTQALQRAVLPQKVSLPFSFAVLDVVLMGRTPHMRSAATTARDTDIAYAALDRVSMTAFAQRDYATLSGGEQQRVHLARALAQIWDPPDAGHRYLLLDEPTASLDPAHQHSILRLTRALAQRGVGVMAVLHDFNLAAQYADHVVVLSDGSVVAQGPPENILTPPIIRDVFELDVLVQAHPCHNCPLVVPIHDTAPRSERASHSSSPLLPR